MQRRLCSATVQGGCSPLTTHHSPLTFHSHPTPTLTLTSAHPNPHPHPHPSPNPNPNQLANALRLGTSPIVAALVNFDVGMDMVRALTLTTM